MRRLHAFVLTIALFSLTLLPAALHARAATQRSGSAPAQNRNAPASACSVTVTEAVGRDPLPVCDTTPVTVSLALTCPAQLPMHVVFLIGNHLAMQDDLDAAKKAARDAVNAMTWTPGTKVGVISLSAEAKRELELTDSKGLVISAINRIQLDPINPFQRYYDWVGAAQQMLEEGRPASVSPIEAVVVYSTGCPQGFESYCARQIASAGKAKNEDITVSGVCNPNAKPFGFALPSGHCKTLQQMSTQGYYHDLAQASKVGNDLVALSDLGANLKLDTVTLQEVLAPGIALQAASALPVPKIKGQQLTFSWTGVMPGQVVTASYRAQAAAMGRQPLRTSDSAVSLVDTLNRGAGPITVPLRTLNVVECKPLVPTATPTSLPPEDTPTPTATQPPPTAPATATDTPVPPTATSVPGEIFLPILMRHACRPTLAQSDIVLVIDASSSMDEASGGVTKIAAAKLAARHFVDLLNVPLDHAAIVAFNHAATLRQGLTADRAALAQAIDGIATEPGTRIDAALTTATSELGSERVRPQSTRVIILLTDGRTEEGTAPAALATADVAKAQGTLIYTIGLGADVDADFLRRIATSPSYYFAAPDATTLVMIYDSISRELPCPDGVLMGAAGNVTLGGNP